MRYASVCDGIGAVHVAWQPLGWHCEWTAEIDAFPAAVVEQRWGFPNRGDMTKFTEWNDESIDLLVGGTPCQSFSVAGLRKGLHDPRGGLMLTFLEIAQRYRPRWVVWENVPGVLSSNGGRDFGAFLGALGELGYGWAYRVLDAQWFGVAQRRRRVFVVGCLGDERRAAQVLFESESVRRDNPPSRAKGQGITGSITARFGRNGGAANDDLDGRRLVAFHPTQDPISSQDGLVHALGTGSSGGCATATVAFDTTQITSKQNYSRPKAGDPCHPLSSTAHPPAIAFTQNSRDEVRQINGDGQLAGALSAEAGMHQTNYIAFAQNQLGEVRTNSEVMGTVNTNQKASGRNTPMVMQPLAVRTAQTSANGHGVAEGICHTLDQVQGQAVAFSHSAAGNSHGIAYMVEGTPPLRGGGAGNSMPAVATAMAVRRLTPMECERLQGFPDHYTAITYRNKPAADGPRYKALGNSMAVPVMAWIGRRIAENE
jgi:DNA (cytosine-5)-methyltransferase 1